MKPEKTSRLDDHLPAVQEVFAQWRSMRKQTDRIPETYCGIRSEGSNGFAGAAVSFPHVISLGLGSDILGSGDFGTSHKKWPDSRSLELRGLTQPVSRKLNPLENQSWSRYVAQRQWHQEALPAQASPPKVISFRLQSAQRFLIAAQSPILECGFHARPPGGLSHGRACGEITRSSRSTPLYPPLSNSK